MQCLVFFFIFAVGMFPFLYRPSSYKIASILLNHIGEKFLKNFYNITTHRLEFFVRCTEKLVV